MCRALRGGRLDGDKARHGGLGVLRAVGNVNGEIAGALLGRGFAACLNPMIAIARCPQPSLRREIAHADRGG